MSKKDLDDPDAGIIAQDMGSLDLGYGAVPPSYNISSGYGTDTITIDSSLWSTGSTTISNGGYATVTGSTTIPYTYATTGTPAQFLTSGANGHIWNTGTTVHIDSDGLTMKTGADIKIGGKSLTEAIEKIEERLGILRPNSELEERWSTLKELRKQYMELEKDILEKEKIMKILKEK